MKNSKKRERRSPEQMIADLEQKIAQVKARAERQKVRRDPALRHITGAVRAIDKAMSLTQDAATRKTLDEARTALGAVLTLNGAPVGPGSKERGGRRAAAGGSRVEPERVLEYLHKHPGSRSEDIASALGTDSSGLRPALMKLKSEGRAKTKGKARATRYFVGSES